MALSGPPRTDALVRCRTTCADPGSLDATELAASPNWATLADPEGNVHKPPLVKPLWDRGSCRREGQRGSSSLTSAAVGRPPQP